MVHLPSISSIIHGTQTERFSLPLFSQYHFFTLFYKPNYEAGFFYYSVTEYEYVLSLKLSRFVYKNESIFPKKDNFNNW